jgi:uncharacterized phage protein (TIGR01671 family)
MNRELKFRLWRNNKKKMYFVTNLNFLMQGFEDSYEVEADYFDNDNEPYIIDNENNILEQYTGLNDKDGKEIYEGDIVQSTNHHPDKFEIRFVEGGFCAWWGNDEFPIDINHFYDSKGCCIKVIGNIHENPELLN